VDPAGDPDRPARPAGGLSKGLGFRLGRLSRHLRRSWSEELAAVGLTPPLAAVLRGVAESPGVSVRALARTIGTDPMSVKRCADELESRRLLRSGRLASDRRPRTLTITPSGRELVTQIEGRLASQERSFDAALTATDRATLERLLDRLEAGLGVGEDVVPAKGQKVVLRRTSDRKLREE